MRRSVRAKFCESKNPTLAIGFGIRTRRSETEYRVGGKANNRQETGELQNTPQDLERAHLLRRLGNELRVAGRLREAGEAFRRALNVTPRGAWLIYDFARLLRSQASAQADARLLLRARAALRLASIRADDDLVLLPLIGESFLECGDARFWPGKHCRRQLISTTATSKLGWDSPILLFVRASWRM